MFPTYGPYASSPHLFCTKRPCRELLEQPRFLRRAWHQGFREHVEKRLRQSLADDFRRNDVHHVFQHLKVFIASVLECSPVSHSHVHREVQVLAFEGAVGVVVVPATSIRKRKFNPRGGAEKQCMQCVHASRRCPSHPAVGQRLGIHITASPARERPAPLICSTRPALRQSIL